MGRFGKTSIGATASSVFNNEYDSTVCQVEKACRVIELWTYCENPDSVTLGFKIGCYTSNVSHLPVNFKGGSDEVSLAAGAVAAWRQAPIASPGYFDVAAGEHHLGHFGVNGAFGTSLKVYSDAGLGSFCGMTYPTFADPAITPTGDSIAYSIYAVFVDIPDVDYSQFPKYKLRRPGR